MKFPVASRALTLVSLLVTVSCIMVLLAILIPSLLSARKQAQRTQCAVNLRNIGRATELYRMDYRVIPLSYRGAEPNARYHGADKQQALNQDVLFDNATWRDYRWPGLPTLLNPYLQGHSGVFVCPATPSANPIAAAPKPTSPGSADTPVITGSYIYFMGDMGNAYAGNGLGNQFYYYPGTPPVPYDKLSFPVNNISIDENIMLAQDRFYMDETPGNNNGNNGNGNGNGNSNGNGNGNGNNTAFAYGNHPRLSASWQPDTFTPTDYRVGIYRSASIGSFYPVNVLRLDGTVTQVPIKDLTPVMIKDPGIGNGKIIYGAFPP